jgi:MEMO1 family protein
MQSVRPPAVAGLFYPGQPDLLRVELGALLGAAPEPRPQGTLKVLLVPHAGYVYSGAVAAAAYARLRLDRERIRRVVLLGPTHRAAVRGVAIPAVDRFATPRGSVALDRETLAKLARLPNVVVSAAAHASEHALEVQLPFLQVVLDDFVLVPLAVGNVDDAASRAVVEAVWGDDETMVIVSSDLSHYHPYREAQILDRTAVAQMLALRGGLDHEQACGATPLNAVLSVARARGLHPHLLAQCNSGDTAGDRARVVGYCAVAFEVPTDGRH